MNGTTNETFTKVLINFTGTFIKTFVNVSFVVPFICTDLKLMLRLQ